MTFTCLHGLLRHEPLSKQSSCWEVMFIFELFRVIVLPIDIHCIICYRVTVMKQISSECQTKCYNVSYCYSSLRICIFFMILFFSPIEVDVFTFSKSRGVLPSFAFTSMSTYSSINNGISSGE